MINFGFQRWTLPTDVPEDRVPPKCCRRFLLPAACQDRGSDKSQIARNLRVFVWIGCTLNPKPILGITRGSELWVPFRDP